MRFVIAPVVVAACLLAVSMTPLHAQIDSREGIALENQIYSLRQELKGLEDQVARGAAAGTRSQVYAPPVQQGSSGDLLAQLLTRVDALEEQVRQLRGRVDETQNQLQRQNDDLSKRIDDLAFQINPKAAQPQGVSPSDFPNQGPPLDQLVPPAPARPAPPAAPRTPETILKQGNAALARHDYSQAEAAAREVLANRTSPRAYDARLLLAQSLYGEKEYSQAAIKFDDAYNTSRKGTHAQDALAGLAGSLAAINEKKAACDTLTRLRTEFPEPRDDVAASAAATAHKAGC